MEHHNLKGYGKVYDRAWFAGSDSSRGKVHWPFQSVVTNHSVMSFWSSADGAEAQARPGAAVPVDVRVTEPAVARVAPRRARWHSRSLMSFSFSLRSSNTEGDDLAAAADDDTNTHRSLVPDYIVNYLRGDTPETVARRQAERRRAAFDAHIRALGPTPTSPGWSIQEEEEEKMRARQQLLEKRKWWQWRPGQPQLPQHPLLAAPAHSDSDSCGWRAGVGLFAALAAVLTLAGLAVLVLALRSNGHVISAPTNGARLVGLVFGLRAALAVIAALALATAQYVWQAAGSSVTRAELDAAHARRQWLDLGLPSVRNAAHLLRYGDAQGRGRVLTSLVLVVLALGMAVLCGSLLLIIDEASDVSSLFVHTPVLVALIALHGITALSLAALLLATRVRHRHHRHTPLVTLGDAIASFLRDADLTTRGACMLSKKEVWRWQKQQDNQTDIQMSSIRRPLPPPLFHPVVCRADTPSARWFRAASPLRWLIGGLVWFGLVGLALAALILVVTSSSSSAAAVIGSFGQFTLDQAIYTRQLASSSASSWASISTSLLAALPQLGPALLFLIAHAHLCVYFLSHESALFAAAATTAADGIRLPLRVSTRPHGFQTTSLYLTLPLPWSCLLLLLYVGQHFALSNSVIAAGEQASSILIGFSGLGLVVVLGLLAALALLVLGLACRCSPSAAPGILAGNPLSLPGGSCSAVISARCHPLTDETTETVDPMANMMTRATTPAMTLSDAGTASVPATASSDGGPLPLWLRPLAWGPVPGRRPSSDTDQSDDIGHCTYSSRPLLPLDVSRSYA